MDTLTLGRASNEVVVGDLVEMLLSISFAREDAMLEWSWLGIDSAYVSNVQASLEAGLQYPWHVGYSALRCMACQNWQSQHACPMCKRPDRNHSGGKEPWSKMTGCLEHLQNGMGCIGSLLNVDSSDTTGATMIPSKAQLLKKMHPTKCTRDFMPASTIMYMGPGGHRHALLDRFSLLILRTRKCAIAHLTAAVKECSKWCPKYYRKGAKVIAEAPSSNQVP